MTVPAKPFYLSAADTEFNANNYASDILSKAGIAAPRLCGDLAGKSAAGPIVATSYLTRGFNGATMEGGYIDGQIGSLSPVAVIGKSGERVYGFHSFEEVGGGLTLDVTSTFVGVINTSLGEFVFTKAKNGSVRISSYSQVTSGNYTFTSNVPDITPTMTGAYSSALSNTNGYLGVTGFDAATGCGSMSPVTGPKGKTVTRLLSKEVDEPDDNTKFDIELGFSTPYTGRVAVFFQSNYRILTFNNSTTASVETYGTPPSLSGGVPNVAIIFL